MQDGPLDMRMDTTTGSSVADLLATLDERSIADIIWKFGEEPRSRAIARAIVHERDRNPLLRTRQLAELVARHVKGRPGHHPATRTFQALRIHVNDELGALERALVAATRALRPAGRLAVITFHSLEDRIVKQFFRKHSMVEIDNPTWPAPRPNPDRLFELVTPRSVTASPEELASNPRSRSARLRVAERLASTKGVAQ
jgi:16S rRNA (cytosine1402-N4)-methyltransferase